MRWSKKQGGVVAVEFAIVLIPMVLIVFGITELGRAFYQYNTLVKATRDAVRYKSFTNQGVNEAEAKCLAVTGDHTNSNGSCAGTPLVEGLNTNMVTIGYLTAVPTGSSSINLVKVTINDPSATEKFQFVSLVNFVIPDITFGPIGAVMRAPT
jgi:Flp pilus assembly protein TadG